jgi:hypothetical protein
MKDLLVHLDDLPDEILIYTFKKLYNAEVLHSFMGVNQRLNRIVHDTIFTRNLCLLEYCPVNDSTFPLPNPILDRFCSKILPEIGHQIETLFLERTSIERVLNATNYPNLNNLGLCDIHGQVAMSLFAGKRFSLCRINYLSENKMIYFEHIINTIKHHLTKENHFSFLFYLLHKTYPL